MNLSELQSYSSIDLLKYLAYLQVCQENSSHLQTLQDLQNRVLNGEDITADESLWIELEDVQTGLFVENFICFKALQFRAFVSDAIERPWQIAAWIDHLIKYKLKPHKALHPIFFFLCLSEKIADKLRLGYYEIGDYTENVKIQLLDIDDKRLACLSFTKEELEEVGHHRVDLSVLDEYISEEGCDIGLKPILRLEDSYFILSPNALMNCAWRELLKVLKNDTTDDEIYQMYHAFMAEEIHNSLSEKWISKKSLNIHEDNAYTAVYLVFHHRYFVVSVVAKSPKVIELDSINPPDDIDVLDVSQHLVRLDDRVKSFDKDAEIVHIVVPVTLQNELAAVSSNAPNPVLMMLWPPLQTLIKKDDDNALWLYYYALDRKNTNVLITPGANEEDVIALYLEHNHSFYLSDNATGKQVAYLAPGLALPILYDIKRRGNRHAVEEPPVNIVVERDQDCPEGLPFYETRVGDYDLMVGEFMISCLFIRLPQNCKDSEPVLHAVGRSLILWYYALEHSSGRPVLKKNYKLSVVSDDSIKDGFLLEERAISILKIGQNLFGSEEGHVVEQRLLEAILGDADKKGLVLNTAYKSLITKVFSDCKGGLILRLSEHDVIGDNTIGERHHYVVDGRRKSLVIAELAEKFNRFPVGLLTVEESRDLVNEMIHYLNNRVTAIIEEYDLEKFLSSMMTLRDGVIFWNKTMTERYDAMISFYRYLGTDVPVQEKRIHEFVETDLCVRCLVEYALLKCSKHGTKDIHLDIDSVEEMFALMSELINMGYLSDYYKSPTFDKVIEVLPNKRFAYPVYEEVGLSKYAKLTTKDRLEHPDVYNALYHLVEKIDYKEYEEIFKKVFIAEFGVEFDDFVAITTSIIQIMQDEKRDVWIEALPSFKDKVVKEAKVEVKAMDAYVNAFSISAVFHDLSLFPVFKEHDTFPCRYKRKLGLIYRPICAFDSHGATKVAFSFRGFVQSQYNLLDNIRISNYSSVSDVMGKYIGQLNNRRGRNFEAGVYELYKTQEGIVCHRSAQIGPKDRLQNKAGALGDINLMLIDNESQRILLVEAKNYNECKTPYEAVDNEKKLLGDMSKAVKRDKWAKKNKALFKWYAQQPTDNYQLASIMLTFNLTPTKFFNDDYKTELPLVWMRDVIENPKRIFDYGLYE